MTLRRLACVLTLVGVVGTARAHDDGPPPPGPPMASPLPPPPPPPPKPAKAQRPGLASAPIYGLLSASFPTDEALREIKGLLQVARLDGWLLTDLRGDNPTALDLVRPARPTERRWFYLVPTRGEPVLVAHVGDAAAFTAVPGKRVAYATWRDLGPSLKATLKGRRRLAMENGASLALPSTRIDSAVADAVRAAGAQVFSSGDLRLQRARWDGRAREQHKLALFHLGKVRDEALEMIIQHLGEGQPLHEVTVEKAMLRSLRARGLETDAPPAVAAGRNTAVPGYVATVARTGVIQPEDVIVLRLAARVRAPGAPYAVVTHVAYAGTRVPEKVARAYAAARAAGPAAVALLRERLARRQPVRAWELDAAARKVLLSRGLGDRALHPTGHALEPRFPGTGLSLDDYDQRDERVVQRGLALRVSPGVYFAGEFGVRAERAILIGEKDVEELDPGQTRLNVLFPGPTAELMELE
ncbi:MAG: M24 family metallopeptidase [Deltaproteobacteria bacterium]|nr:M24 family metallopeptidase [Deltaproteobacteria bacterium]